MKISTYSLGLLVALAVVIGITWMVKEIPDGHGFEHATYSTMDQGGPGADRHCCSIDPE